MPTKRKNKKNFRLHLTDVRWLAAITLVTATFLGLAVFFYPRYYAPPPDMPTPPMKDLAASRGVQLGTMAHAEWLTRRPLEGVLGTQFNLVTSDWELHWDRMRPVPTEYNYDPVDALVLYAEEHEMDVEGHHLVWGEDDSLPPWLKTGNFSKEQLMDMMQKHISTVVGHYKGRMTQWSVVNEPFTRDKHTYGLDNWWGDHVGGGTDYIDKAFTWAREADPDAKLILNDFNNETKNGISDAQYAYMKSAKERGIPIDGIGMQMHLDASRPPNKDAMIWNMQRFGELGYKVYITEFDINSMTVNGSRAQKDAIGAQISSDVVEACIRAGNCVSLTIFGITDRKNVITFTHSRHRDSLFSSTYKPKPAFYTFRSAWTAH